MPQALPPQVPSDPSPEWKARMEEVHENLNKAIREYVEHCYTPVFPEDPALVQAWAVSVEWTNMFSAQNGAGGTVFIVKEDQMQSTTIGLGTQLLDTFRGGS